MAKAAKEKRVPSYGEAYLCVVLVFGIVIGAMILGIPVQATMLFAAIIAAAFAYNLGYTWIELEQALSAKLGHLAPTVCILWLIGLYLGANMFSGTLPLLVRRAEVDVVLSTSQPFRITALNCDGESLGEIASSFHDGVQRFTLRTDSHPGGVMAYSLTR